VNPKDFHGKPVQEGVMAGKKVSVGVGKGGFACYVVVRVGGK
jgi:hypothetical protein